MEGTVTGRLGTEQAYLRLSVTVQCQVPRLLTVHLSVAASRAQVP